MFNSTTTPSTRSSLRKDFKDLGITEGMVLIVHSSLKSIGWVIGGSVTVVQALLDSIGTSGTLIMPTHSSDYSDPEPWQHPPVPPETWPIIRMNMPAFDPQITPSKNMGAIAEVFRTFPGVERSYHPTVSFCAFGKYAKQIVSNHSLSYPLGDGSPLARAYELNGYVLLLGVGFDKNTSFHLAEYRLPKSTVIYCGSPIFENNQRIWKTYEDIQVNDKPFAKLGADFETKHPVSVALIGQARSKLFSQRSAVDYAVQWLKHNHDQEA